MNLDGDGAAEFLPRPELRGGAHCCADRREVLTLRRHRLSRRPGPRLARRRLRADATLDGDGPAPSSSPPTPPCSDGLRRVLRGLLRTRRGCSTTTSTAKGADRRRHAALPEPWPAPNAQGRACATLRPRPARPLRRPRAARRLRRRPLPAGPRARGAPVPGAGTQARRPAQRHRARAAQLRAPSCWPSCTSRATARALRASATTRRASSPSVTTSPWPSWRPRRVSTSPSTLTAPCSRSARACPRGLGQARELQGLAQPDALAANTAAAKRLVVALVLVGVGLGEVGERVVEARRPTRGSRRSRRGRRSGRGRGRGSSRRALRVERQLVRPHRLDVGRTPSRPTAGGRRSRARWPSSPVAASPAEEDVAGRLHQPLALDDPLALVRRSGCGRRTARAPTPAPP